MILCSYTKLLVHTAQGVAGLVPPYTFSVSINKQGLSIKMTPFWVFLLFLLYICEPLPSLQKNIWFSSKKRRAAWLRGRTFMTIQMINHPFVSLNKDSFITQDRSEHFNIGYDEANFLRSNHTKYHKVPIESYGYYHSNNTQWVFVGKVVWTPKPCKVENFPQKIWKAKNAPFSHALKTCFGTLFFKQLSFKDR